MFLLVPFCYGNKKWKKMFDVVCIGILNVVCISIFDVAYKFKISRLKYLFL